MIKRLITTLILAAFVVATPLARVFGSQPQGCQSPLDEETLQFLSFLTPFDSIEAQPGQIIDFDLYDVRTFDTVNACVRWSVSATEFVATIDPATGVLTIGPTAVQYPLTVTATIEDCRRIMSIQVYVYNSSMRPLVGSWREVRRFNCNGREVTQGDPVNTLVLRADGHFHVLFRPFEFGYFEYWGRYAADSTSGGFTFEIVGQNQPICCTDRNGKFSFNEHRQLVFENLSFGAIGSTGRRACKYVFEPVATAASN